MEMSDQLHTTATLHNEEKRKALTAPGIKTPAIQHKAD
jgi:hypothetical protein